MSRSKNQEVSFFLGMDYCRVYVHSGAKHNHHQYICGKTKWKCALKGHQACQSHVNLSYGYRPRRLHGQCYVCNLSARKLEGSTRKANREAAARASPDKGGRVGSMGAVSGQVKTSPSEGWDQVPVHASVGGGKMGKLPHSREFCG
jgi:hypothetical protein